MAYVFPDYHPPAQDPSIIFADEHILVIDKPSGLLSVPGKGAALADCVERRLQLLFPGAMTVHRLDMETSGVMVYARTRQAHRHLSIQFQNRQVAKSYRAVLWGVLCDETGEIDLPLRCDWPNRPLQRVDFENGKPSLTRWHVLAHDYVRLEGEEVPVTRVRFFPQTGRSHQLRVHAKALGHVILGDRLYAPERVQKAASRLNLHAETLAFRHPWNKRVNSFTSPCPF